MTPWISTTWQAPPTGTTTLTSVNPNPTPPSAVRARVPLEIYTRIMDCLDPVSSSEDRTTLARCMRVFGPYSDFTATRLYRHLDLRWFNTVKKGNPFNVSLSADPELFLELGILMKRPEAELDGIRKQIGKNDGPLPRPHPQHFALCRSLVITAIDDDVLHVIGKNIHSVDIMYIPLTTMNTGIHRHVMGTGDPDLAQQSISRSIKTANNMNTPILVLRRQLLEGMGAARRSSRHQMFAAVKGTAKNRIALESSLGIRSRLQANF